MFQNLCLYIFEYICYILIRRPLERSSVWDHFESWYRVHDLQSAFDFGNDFGARIWIFEFEFQNWIEIDIEIGIETAFRVDNLNGGVRGGNPNRP